MKPKKNVQHILTDFYHRSTTETIDTIILNNQYLTEGFHIENIIEQKNTPVGGHTIFKSQRNQDTVKIIRNIQTYDGIFKELNFHQSKFIFKINMYVRRVFRIDALKCTKY